VLRPALFFFGVSPLPAPNRRAAYAGATRHFKNVQPIGRVQHNASTLHMLERHKRFMPPRAVRLHRFVAEFADHLDQLISFAAALVF
jgi:hypothetical protein